MKRVLRAVITFFFLISTITPAAFHVAGASGLVASFSHTPLVPARTQAITFNASTSGGTAPFAFSWTFGDGSNGTGSPITHSYPAIGVYNVTLTAVDSTLQQSSQSQTVTVTGYSPFSFGIASDIGNIGVDYSNSAFYAPRQSLLRLGNTTGLSFFIADGWFADGYYFRNEAAWCNEFKSHFNNIVLVAGETDTGWTSVPYDDVVYNAANNGAYDSSVDSILLHGWGGGSHLAGPTDGSTLHNDNKLRYWDSDGNGQWDPGESVVDDNNGLGVMKSYDPVMYGPVPSTGAVLSFDPKIKYFQRDSNNYYVRPQTNNDFEQYVANCGWPSSLGAWHGSGISCSDALPGEPGYSFPTCYGREYYFDVGYPSPRLRIIVVSPTVQNITGQMTVFGTDVWLYQKNDPHYNWVNSTIKAAYTAGIPQTMVVSFDQCFAMGVEECGQSWHAQGSYSGSTTKIEADLLNLLLDSLGPQGNRLTYLVQGEDKGYSRWYPLATHPPPNFASDGLGCAWDNVAGNSTTNRGLPLTKYFNDVPADVHPEYNPSCFANSQNPGQPYNPWPGWANHGVSMIISAAFGAQLTNGEYPGEILVKDIDGSGVYKYGDPYIGGTEPVPGTPLTGGQATKSHIGFIDSLHEGQWAPGETLFKDGDGNRLYDPGETVFSGPVPGTQQPAAFNDSDVKLIDTNGNGIWDKLNGNPHSVLESPYLATWMGANTACSNTVYSTTCPGHGWVSFTFNAASNQTNIATNFCIDGERPTHNYGSCISTHVYSDMYTILASADPAPKGSVAKGFFLGVNATLAFNINSISSSGSASLTAWFTATNTSSAQVFVSNNAATLTLNKTLQGFEFVYQFNSTTSNNKAQPWLAFACKFAPDGSNSLCFFERTPDIGHYGVVNLIDFATLASAFGSRPGDPRWSANCDVHNDGVVDIVDAANLAFFFDSPVFTVARAQ